MTRPAGGRTGISGRPGSYEFNREDPEATQFIPNLNNPRPQYIEPAWANPPAGPRPNRTSVSIGAAVAVVAIVGIITAIVMSANGPGTTKVGLGSVSTPVAAPTTNPNTAPTTANAAPTDDPGPDPTSNADPANSPDPPAPSAGADPEPGPNNGGNPGPIAQQAGSLLNSAMAWMDARNAGDTYRMLQLGCQDDVDAVNSGQASPAAYAGYSSFRPTGKFAPIGTHNLAAYVEYSLLDLHKGTTTIQTIPILWENGGWRPCYYPGVRAQTIAAQA